MHTRVMIVDDHRMVIDGLRRLIEGQADMQVLGDAGDGRRAVELARELKPDVVVMDVTLPEMNGIEATRRMVADHPGLKVIGLSMHSDRRFVAEMLKAGASGYILKDSAFEELHRAIRTVRDGRTYLSPGVTDAVVDTYVRQQVAGVPSAYSVLTAREREVLQLLAEGRTSKEIALRLAVSAKTVETHRQQIMNKLGMHTVAELTKYAVREGLTSLEN